MDAETLATVFSAALVSGLIGGAVAFALPRTRSRFIAGAPVLAALVAIGATAGSLYFSERAGFVPCTLCWYQRIAMYPIALILPLGLLRRDSGVVGSAFALAAIGFAVAVYHVQLQWFPPESTMCEIDNPCSATWVEGFGVFTIPQMAAMAFFLIMMLCIASTFDADTDVVIEDSATVREASTA